MGPNRATGGLSGWVRAAMEGVVLLLVAGLPWTFSAVAPLAERAAFTAVAALMVLWALRMVLERRPIWVNCPVTLCLAGLFLLGAWQITPLPPAALAGLSPGTPAVLGPLLPADGTPGWLAAGSALSLYPAATHAHLSRLLALLALYAAVRSNVASTESLRRLAAVALVNGFLLALVGLLQFFSSPRDVIYWSFRSPAQVFGPMNRNDFACHLNLCIGLGVGLLLSARRVKSRLADDPLSLWIGAALVLMMAALAVCLSRGGIVCLVGAVSLAALARAGPGRAVLVPVVLIGLAAALA
ncbi:MAG: hypothetical protein ACRC33_26465, partial [Gemmataceae bacterium]